MSISKRPNIGDRLWWWFGQIGTLVLCYFAFWEDSLGCKRVLFFLTWLSFALSALALIGMSADEKVKSKVKARGPSGPRWVARLVDFGTAIVVVSAGHFIVATAGLVALYCEEAIFQKDTDTE